VSYKVTQSYKIHSKVTIPSSFLLFQLCYVRHKVKDRNIKKIKAFGSHVQKIRISKGLSQEELADLADIAYSSVNKIENGLLNTSIGTVFDLAKALEIKPRDLLDF
jgi:DNA-binding XRE family transcriptional regulator